MSKIPDPRSLDWLYAKKNAGQKDPAIPDDAIEAAAFIRYKQDHWGQPTRWPTREELGEGKAIFDDAVTLDELKADYSREATEILSAAAPYLIREAQAQALEDAAEAKYDGLYGSSLHAWLYARAAAIRDGAQ